MNPLFFKIFILVSVVFLLLAIVSYTRADLAVDLEWDAPLSGPEVFGYRVYWSTTSNCYDDADSVDVIGETNTSATVSGLDESKSYYFIVKAYNNSYEMSPPSNEVFLEAYSDMFYDDEAVDDNSDEGGCFIGTAAYTSVFKSL